MGYGAVISVRNLFYRKGIFKPQRLPCFVISVGNIAMGGTGKTPTTIYLARLIQRLGYGVVILSRGYKARLNKTPAVVSDGDRLLLDVNSAGDEPCLMGTHLEGIPVIIGKDRFQSGLLACKIFQPHVILLDDAFQHRKLFRDLDLILLDHAKPVGNGYLLPRGILREKPLSLLRGDGIIFTRSDMASSPNLNGITADIRSQAQFRSIHQPYVSTIIEKINGNESEVHSAEDFSLFRGKRAHVFSGIGNNAGFRAMLADHQIQVAGFTDFPDHHEYTSQDIETIRRAALKDASDFIFTTEKDFIRITSYTPWPMDLIVIGVEIVFEDTAFDAFIQNRLAWLGEGSVGTR